VIGRSVSLKTKWFDSYEVSGRFLVGNVAWLVFLVLLLSQVLGLVGCENQFDLLHRFSLCN